MKITVENLSFSYSDGPTICRDISFSIVPGKVIAILGPNGAGKTTLLNCIANLQLPTAGRICIDGKDMRQIPPKEIAQAIGFVPQLIVPTFAYQVIDYVVTGCAPRLGVFQRPKQAHYDTAANAIERMGISHLSKKYYTEISGGERQQASIARALAQQPAVILMDEPTAHLDYGNQIRVLQVIQSIAENGYGVVFTTHNPDHALALNAAVAVMGRKCSFHYSETASILSEDFLRVLYGVDLHVCNIQEVGRDVCIPSKI
ncbi:ABC transporter ATP-binding protein [Christensenellaceae bacterium OttesenSCG-928-M15]|nr:ABC transporter ATP-binding protein [Christensenellaceae bacterium OttesenSCG-928-M15]